MCFLVNRIEESGERKFDMFVNIEDWLDMLYDYLMW